VPKRIALANPEGVATLVAPAMTRLSRMASPIVRFLGWSSEGLVKLLRIPPSSEPAVTEEELTSMLELGTQTGEFHPAEEEMIRGVFTLGDRNVNMVMTRRQDVVWLDLTKPTAELQRQIVGTGFSRYPAGEGSLDQLAGVIEVKDLTADCFSGRPIDMRRAIREPAVVHANMTALQILEMFQVKRADFAIVIDEYGGVAGVVTRADLAMTILGGDQDRLVQRADGSWLVDGMMKFDEFVEEVPLQGVDDNEYETVAGFALAQFGRVPHAGDHFEFSGIRFEVVDMDGHRIDKVLVSRRVT
jgi:putative hemolysin